jgi:hypothetical protein
VSSAVKSFVKRIQVSIRGVDFDSDGSLERCFRGEVAKLDLGDAPLGKPYEPAIICSIQLASTAYSHTPLEVRVQIAMYTLLCLLVDEFSVPAPALEGFVDRMFSGLPQLHPVLDRLVENLQKMKDYYSPWTANQIIKSAACFVDSMAVDSHLKTMKLGPAALGYVTARRLSNGIGEAYAAFIWDKFNFPDVSCYVQTIP